MAAVRIALYCKGMHRSKPFLKYHVIPILLTSSLPKVKDRRLVILCYYRQLELK